MVHVAYRVKKPRVLLDATQNTQLRNRDSLQPLRHLLHLPS